MPGPVTARLPPLPGPGRAWAREGGRGPGRAPGARRGGGGAPSLSRRPRRISPCAGSGALPFGAGGASAREGEMGGRQGGLRLRAAWRPPSTQTRTWPGRSAPWARSAEAKGIGSKAPCPLEWDIPWASFPPGRSRWRGTAERRMGAEPLGILVFVRWESWPGTHTHTSAF